MTLPKTLPGILGFMILSGYLITGFYNEDSGTKALEVNMMNSMNNSALSDNGLLGAVNFVSAIWDGVLLLFAYATNFVGYATRMPPQFTVIYSLFAIMFVIAVIKLVRGVSEFYDR